MLIPYRVNIGMGRWPFANFLLVIVTFFAFFFFVGGEFTEETIKPYFLSGWSLPGMFSHIMIHGGLVHLIGNLIFLWVFGNAICSKLGNLAYIFVYVALGLAAASTHLVLDGRPAIGASGAINGVVGMFVVFYPLNTVDLFYIVFYRFGTVSIGSMWIVFFWLVFDIIGAATGSGGVGYWAHVGGFAGGFLLACVLLKLHWVKMTAYEKSLLDIFSREE